VAAKISSPTNHSSIGSTATFSWSNATGYLTNVNWYSLYVGKDSPASACPAGTACKGTQSQAADANAFYSLGVADGGAGGCYGGNGCLGRNDPWPWTSQQMACWPMGGSTVYVRLITSFKSPATYYWRDYSYVTGAGSTTCPNVTH
jgi:hypothetical protein